MQTLSNVTDIDSIGKFALDQPDNNTNDDLSDSWKDFIEDGTQEEKLDDLDAIDISRQSRNLIVWDPEWQHFFDIAEQGVQLEGEYAVPGVFFTPGPTATTSSREVIASQSNTGNTTPGSLYRSELSENSSPQTETSPIARSSEIFSSLSLGGGALASPFADRQNVEYDSESSPIHHSTQTNDDTNLAIPSSPQTQLMASFTEDYLQLITEDTVLPMLSDSNIPEPDSLNSLGLINALNPPHLVNALDPPQFRCVKMLFNGELNVGGASFQRKSTCMHVFDGGKIDIRTICKSDGHLNVRNGVTLVRIRESKRYELTVRNARVGLLDVSDEDADYLSQDDMLVSVFVQRYHLVDRLWLPIEPVHFGKKATDSKKSHFSIEVDNVQHNKLTKEEPSFFRYATNDCFKHMTLHAHKGGTRRERIKTKLLPFQYRLYFCLCKRTFDKEGKARFELVSTMKSNEFRYIML